MSERQSDLSRVRQQHAKPEPTKTQGEHGRDDADAAAAVEGSRVDAENEPGIDLAPCIERDGDKRDPEHCEHGGRVAAAPVQGHGTEGQGDEGDPAMNSLGATNTWDHE